MCVIVDHWRHSCCQFGPVDCISRLSGSVELTLRYTTPDIHCRHRRHECDGGMILANSVKSVTVCLVNAALKGRSWCRFVTCYTQLLNGNDMAYRLDCIYWTESIVYSRQQTSAVHLGRPMCLRRSHRQINTCQWQRAASCQQLKGRIPWHRHRHRLARHAYILRSDTRGCRCRGMRS